MQLFLVVVLVVATSGVRYARGAGIVIINNDGPGEGFNDATPVAPVGGNTGTTLGVQRLLAFQYAANLWAQCLVLFIDIEVEAQMDPLLCSETSAILGSAAATFVHRDWVAGDPPPKPGTWYPQALANTLAGVDLNPFTPEVTATFNSSLNGDPACLGGVGWYYGFDLNPGNDIDFVTVVFHEIGHGLGFQPMIDLATGEKFMGFDDAYEWYMEHHAQAPPDYPSMSDTERAAGNISDPDLHWTGGNVNATAMEILSYGMSGGHTRLHGPNPGVLGASLAHWTHMLWPDQLMEPYYTGPIHDGTLEVELLKDIGWPIAPKEPVATFVTMFDAVWDGRGVRLGANFRSDVGTFTVTVYRNGETIAERDVAGDSFEYTDADVEAGHSYSYQLGARDRDGEFFSPLRTVTVPGAASTLAQNAPNPFNPRTTIRFTVAGAQHVRLVVYDAEGKRIKTLVDDTRPRGEHVALWDGTDDGGRPVASGVYFYRLVTGKTVESRKMMLLK